LGLAQYIHDTVKELREMYDTEGKSDTNIFSEYMNMLKESGAEGEQLYNEINALQESYNYLTDEDKEILFE
jgi:hypothetical protein